jgi:hypothetical protein
MWLQSRIPDKRGCHCRQAVCISLAPFENETPHRLVIQALLSVTDVRVDSHVVDAELVLALLAACWK